MDFIDRFVIRTIPAISLNQIFLPKFVAYLFINAIIFMTLLRFKNAAFLFLFYFFQALYLFVHLAYFLYFNNAFHANQFFSQFFEGLDLAQHLAVPLNIKYLIIFIDLPIAIMILVNYVKLNSFIRFNTKIINLICAIFVSSLLFMLPLSYKNYKIFDEEKDRYKSEADIIGKIGLLGNDFLDLLSFKDEKKLIKDFDYGSQLSFNATGNKMKNIICIQVESLSSGIVNYMYKGQYITPFLHELSSRCIYYPYMIYYYGEGCTSDTEFSVLNSAVPLRRFPSFKLRNYSYPNSLIPNLLRSDYEAKAFHNNVGSYFNRRAAFSKMGFQKFYDLENMGLKEQGWGAADSELINYVINKLKRQQMPFFYYIITMSSHEPFNNVRLYYRNQLYDDIDSKIIKNYFNSFSYVDNVLKDFILFVKNNLRDTYIFIYGDHDVYEISKYLFKRKDAVPLFIITPEDKKYVENNLVVSSIDLAPSILYASGIKFCLRTKGVNLLDVPIKDNPIVFRNGKYSRQFLFERINSIKETDYSGLKENKINLPEFIAHGGGIIRNIPVTNSLEALEASYRKGFNFIEVDLEWTLDKHLVMIHDWAESVKRLFGAEPKKYSLAEFKKLKMLYNLKQATLDELLIWLEKHPGTFIVTDIKKDNVSALRYISQQYKDTQNQIIPQIYDFKEYDIVKELGFTNPILTLYRENDSDEDLLKFLSNHSVLAVTLPLNRAMTDLPSRLNRMGIFVYAHTINDKELKNELRAKGVDGFYTDTLKPQ